MLPAEDTVPRRHQALDLRTPGFHGAWFRRRNQADPCSPGEQNRIN